MADASANPLAQKPLSDADGRWYVLVVSDTHLYTLGMISAVPVPSYFFSVSVFVRKKKTFWQTKTGLTTKTAL
jgi:hypothetical protein